MRILDSDHCVALLRGKLDITNRVEPQEILGVTSVTVGELVHGACRSVQPERNLAQIEVLLSAVTVVVFDNAAAHRFGRIKAQLEAQGAKLADLDLQIAATCLETTGTLVTHNTRHFGRITDLKLEDWLT